MAKKANAEVEQTEEQNTQSGVVATITDEKGKEVNVAQLLEQINNAEVGQELTSEYFTLEPGENSRVVLLEMTEMNKMGGEAGETTDAVRLLGSDGKFKICADKVIVSTARSILKDGKKNIPVLITCTGKSKSAKGTYKEFTINSLLM